MEYVPAGQGSQLARDVEPFTVEYVPIGHCKHESLLGSAGAIEYVPHGQYLQNAGEDDPTTSENVPIGQDVQF